MPSSERQCERSAVVCAARVAALSHTRPHPRAATALQPVRSPPRRSAPALVPALAARARTTEAPHRRRAERGLAARLKSRPFSVRTAELETPRSVARLTVARQACKLQPPGVPYIRLACRFTPTSCAARSPSPTDSPRQVRVCLDSPHADVAYETFLESQT